MTQDETMQALWLEQGALELREIPRPSLAEGEALVRVRVAGVCGTDLELCKGYIPFTGVPGHEFVGNIVEAPGWPERVGQRVVGDINAACGHCATCRAGRPTHCPDRTVLGIVNRPGAFAEYLALPLGNLHPVPARLPDDAAVFTELVAAALEVLEQVHVRPTDRVAVVGAGRLGQLLAQVLALTGCDLLVAAKHERQRQVLDTRGIPHLSPQDLSGLSVDVAVEATGTPEGFELARSVVRPRGTVVLNSTYAGETTVNMSAVVVDELTLVASRCGPFPPALRLMTAGHVEPHLLLEARYPLSRALEAFDHARRPGAFKVLVTPTSG